MGRARRLAVDGAQGPQHLDLLVAHDGGVEVGRRLHGGQGQKLQHVVLHHVAQRAGLVVEPEPPFHAHGLGDGDLHMVDAAGVPQRLEEGVGEPQGDQVLDRLLAQVVVDPERPAFRKHGGDRVVDRLAGRPGHGRAAFPAPGVSRHPSGRRRPGRRWWARTGTEQWRGRSAGPRPAARHPRRVTGRRAGPGTARAG